MPDLIFDKMKIFCYEISVSGVIYLCGGFSASVISFREF